MSRLTLINFGLVGQYGIIDKQIDIETYGTTHASVTVDGIVVEPNHFVADGKKQIHLVLDPGSFKPGALLEGHLIIESASGISRIRITGSIEDVYSIDEKSSIASTQTPWQREKVLHGHQNKVWGIAIDKTATLLLSCSEDQTVKIWDIERAKYDTLNFTTPPLFIAISPNNHLFAVGLRDGSLHVHELATARKIWHKNIHSSAIFSIAFAPNSEFLVSGSGDRTISVSDSYTGNLSYEPLRQEAIVTAIAIAGHGHVLASTSQNKKIFLWDISTGQRIRELVGHEGNIWTIAFSLDGHMIASGSGDKTIILWDTQSGQIKSKIDGFKKDVFRVALSPDGTILASSSGEPKIRIWNTHTQQKLATLENSDIWVRDLVFSPRQDFLAGALDDGNINIWRVDNPLDQNNM